MNGMALLDTNLATVDGIVICLANYYPLLGWDGHQKDSDHNILMVFRTSWPIAHRDHPDVPLPLSST